MALKDVPETFDPDSEEDLRFAVALYFRELGFERDELSFEDQFSIRLGHNTFRVARRGTPEQRDQARGRSDLLLLRNGEPIAIVETKAPDHRLTNDDAWQALSYASLLRPIAPYAIVTNGRETQVYDTLASITDDLTPLDDSTGSSWHRDGQQTPSIHEDLRFRAARTLIGVNPQTLKAFCQEQLAQALEDLRGPPQERKAYIPDVYLPRQDIVDQFNAWLSSDLPCFAVVGDSGMGKTNFVCATAERLSEDNFVLFYPAMRLAEGLLAAIRNDFVWEFHRECSPAYIVERFDEIAGRHGQRLVICVDGLDEFPGNREAFKAELLDFVYRLREHSVYLCVSCKSLDWSDFVLDRGQTYNRLAKSIYPPRDSVHNPPSIQSPDPEYVGVWLSEFTDDELDTVLPRYRDVFSLRGELHGATRVECQKPLMLRLVAEVYSGRDAELPDEVISRELFDLYWERRLSEVQHRLCVEQILAEVAFLSVQSGERQVELSTLRERLDWNDSVADGYQDAMRFGLLREIVDSGGYRWMTFGFERMRSYVYTVRARRWPLQEPRDTARMICELLGTPLGVEAVEFYLTTIDRGETRVLTEVALLDFDSFAQLTHSFELRSSIVQDVPSDDRQAALWNRLEQYAVAYSEISRRYFPDLCERIVPYTRGEAGIWVYGSMYQHRARTEAYPNPVVLLSDEVAAGLWNRDLPLHVYAALRPAGIKYVGMSDIAKRLPQKLAWDRIQSQIADLFKNRLLDESSSSALLQERIREILLYEPHWWVRECHDLRTSFRQLLGFEIIEDVYGSAIEDLAARTSHLLSEYQAQIPEDTEPTGLEGYPRWCYGQVRWLRRLYYCLELLRPLRERLEAPKFGLEEVFEYLRARDLAPAIPVVKSLIPDIRDSYCSLALRSFSRIVDQLPFYRYRDSSMLVQVMWQRPEGPFHSDYITLGYILLPSVALPGRYLVYAPEREDYATRLPLRRQTLRGFQVSRGAAFGQTSISLHVGDLYIEEPNAFLCFTRFPSHHPILNQAYQLLGQEVQYVTWGDSVKWSNVEYGNVDNDMLDWWIGRQWASRHLDQMVK